MKKEIKNLPKGAVTLEQHRKEMFKRDPAFKKAYDDLELEYQILDLMIRRRIEKKLTQTQLAKKLGIKQPVISQFEKGTFNPTVKFLKKLAKALDAKLEIKIS